MIQKQARQDEPVTQAPDCPVCHRSDQVQTMQAASQPGRVELQEPSSPEKSRPVWPWVIVGGIVVICAAIQFFLFIQVGGPAGLGSWPVPFQILEVAGAAIILVLLASLSLLAFRHLATTNRETVWRYPTTGTADQKQRQLYRCERDHVVFDADQQRVLSNEELRAFLKETRPQ